MANVPDFLIHPAFWFALVNLVAIFIQRFGVTLTVTELASINTLIAVIFGVGKPDQALYAAKLNALNKQQKLVE